MSGQCHPFESPAFDEDPPDLSQRLQRVASLRHILAANIPCALWGEEAFLWHSSSYIWHEAHVLIPDAQIAAAAAALVSSGEFTTTPPTCRIGVIGCDIESIYPSPCVRLFTTTPPVLPWEGYDLPDETPSVEILLIPASTYSVDLVKQADLFDAYPVPDWAQTIDETRSSTLPPSLLVPKHTTLIASMAAFLLGNNPNSRNASSLRYHMSCLAQYQFSSEQWDENHPLWSPNTKEEALELRRTVLAELGTDTNARWLYELVIESTGLGVIEIWKRLEARRADNTRKIKAEDQPRKSNLLDCSKIRTICTNSHPSPLISGHTPLVAPSLNLLDRSQTSLLRTPVRSARRVLRRFPVTVLALRKK